MYDKLIELGRRGGEHWRVRDKLEKLVDGDHALLGELLWRAVREGHAFAIANPHLVYALASTPTSPSADDLVAYLSHAAFAWNVPASRNAPARASQLVWHEDLATLIAGGVRDDASARRLVTRLADVPAEVREVVPYILAMRGHLDVGALPDDALARCARTWLSSDGRRRLELRPPGAGHDVLGVALLWPRRWWPAVVEQALRPDTGGYHVRRLAPMCSMFGAATDEQVIGLLWRAPADASVVPQAVVETRPHLKPQLAARLRELASGDVSRAPWHTLEVLVGTLLRFMARDGDVPPTWLDPLIGRCIAERYATNRSTYDYNHRYGYVIDPEHLKLLGESRLAAVAAHESPPWHLAVVCRAPAVLREVARALAEQCTARPRGWVSNGVDDYLERIIGRDAAPYIAEVVGNAKTWRPEMLDALFTWRDPATLPALVALLSANADTRRRVVEGLKAWGEPVVDHLGPALAARRIKARIEAANLLAALAASPRALALAAEHLGNENDDAVRALLAPLAAEHEANQRRAAAGNALQRPPWQEREAFDRAIRTAGGDGWPSLLEQGADALDEAVHYLRELPELLTRRTFWRRRLRVEHTSRRVAVVNVQRLIFAAAEHLASTAPLSDDARDAVEHWIGEPDGAEHLAALGPGVLAPIVEWLDPTHPAHPPTEAFLADLFDRERGVSRFSRLMWSALESDSRELVEQVKQALQTPDAPARRELLENARRRLPDGDTPDDPLELGERLMAEPHGKLRREIGDAAVARALIDWLLARNDAGDFDAVWRSDVIPALGWQHLVALTSRFAPDQQPLDEALAATLTEDRHAWRALDAASATRHVEAIAALIEPGEALTPEELDDIEPRIISRLRKLFEHLGESLAPDTLIERVLQIESTLCRRQPHRGMALEVLDTLVLDRGGAMLDATARCAIVERVAAQRVACTDEAGRKVLYAWLAGRARDPGLPEHDLAIETLVAGLSDAKKEVRQAVREALARVGVPMLAAVRRLLAARKVTVRREAALVVASVPHEDNIAAIDAALAREARSDIAEILRVARLEALPLPALDGLDDAELDDRLVERADHLPPLAAFAHPAKLPAVHWRGGTELSAMALSWLLCQLSRESATHSVAGVAAVCARLEPADRDALARALLAGRGVLHSAEHRWVDRALLHLASDALLADLVDEIDQVAALDEGRATALVDVLVRRGAGIDLLVTLHHVSRREVLRRAAVRALLQLGVTDLPGLLLERAPTFGFDAGGRARCAVSDTGRDVIAGLDARHGVVFVLEGADEPVELDALEQHGLNAPTRKRLTRLVRHVRLCVERERGELELAMATAEPWSGVEFVSRYVTHPVRRTAALGVVFTTAPLDASPDDKIAVSFTVLPTGELTDAESITSPLSNESTVRVIHGVELEPRGRDHWLHRLSALGLSDHLAQLTRPVYSPDREHNRFEEVLFDVPDFESGRALRRAVNKLGFTAHPLEGLVWWASRPYGSRFTVRIEHGTCALSSLNVREPLSLDTVTIDVHDDSAIPPGLHSEVVRLLREQLPVQPAP